MVRKIGTVNGHIISVWQWNCELCSDASRYFHSRTEAIDALESHLQKKHDAKIITIRNTVNQTVAEG